MFKIMTLFRGFPSTYMNTIHLKHEIQHRIPGAFYFFNITEYAYLLEIHIMYTHKKEYRFNNFLTKAPECVIVRSDGV